MDFVISFIRTVIPMVVGALASYMTSKGIELPAEAFAGLVTFLTATLSALYYLIVRWLETKWPAFGWFLGVPGKPKY